MAGSVESVRVENFLNHHNLIVDLCPGVNFITGENGSGKSAILTALCVALVRLRPKRTSNAASLPLRPRRGCLVPWKGAPLPCVPWLSRRTERTQQRAAAHPVSPHPRLTPNLPPPQGASARSTNRAESGARSFVREGAQKATVVVTLRNTGHDAFRPEEFGPTIVVERTITAVRPRGALSLVVCLGASHRPFLGGWLAHTRPASWTHARCADIETSRAVSPPPLCRGAERQQHAEAVQRLWQDCEQQACGPGPAV